MQEPLFYPVYDRLEFKNNILGRYPAIKQLMERDLAILPPDRIHFTKVMIQFKGWSCELYLNWKKNNHNKLVVKSFVLNPIQPAPPEYDQYEI